MLKWPGLVMTTIIASGSSTVQQQQQVDDQAAQQDRHQQHDVAKTSWREEAAVVAQVADRPAHRRAHHGRCRWQRGKERSALFPVSSAAPALPLPWAVALPAAAVPAGPAVIAATMLAPM